MRSQLPRRAERLLKHLSVVIFITGVLALALELTADHRALGPSPLSAVAEGP
ncbi:MAG: hypothetical protein ACI8S6_004206 [Myxococcota bacterium]|jgi:hypothetical protein